MMVVGGCCGYHLHMTRWGTSEGTVNGKAGNHRLLKFTLLSIFAQNFGLGRLIVLAMRGAGGGLD